eukprot:scaffold5232_cov73-Phaeocystis_antarctica.AAC.9
MCKQGMTQALPTIAFAFALPAPAPSQSQSARHCKSACCRPGRSVTWTATERSAFGRKLPSTSIEACLRCQPPALQPLTFAASHSALQAQPACSMQASRHALPAALSAPNLRCQLPAPPAYLRCKP